MLWRPERELPHGSTVIQLDVIPAHAGWHVVVLCHGEGDIGDSLDYSAIIGWRVETYLSARDEFIDVVMPITSESVGSDTWALSDPDGKLYLPQDRTFPDEPSLLSYLRSEADETEQRRLSRLSLPPKET